MRGKMHFVRVTYIERKMYLNDMTILFGLMSCDCEHFMDEACRAEFRAHNVAIVIL